jgi:hypothetical protein
MAGPWVVTGAPLPVIVAFAPTPAMDGATHVWPDTLRTTRLTSTAAPTAYLFRLVAVL